MPTVNSAWRPLRLDRVSMGMRPCHFTGSYNGPLHPGLLGVLEHRPPPSDPLAPLAWLTPVK
jgi:hypothetical protein